MTEPLPAERRSLKARLLQLKAKLRPAQSGSTTEVRIRRRQAMIAQLQRRLPLIKIGLFVIGYLWMVAIPYPDLGSKTYIDENALQPAQVTTYWGWNDVHSADRYLDELERLKARNASSAERAHFVKTEFQKLGIPASTQQYTFSVGGTNLNGTNAYAISSSARASGNEAMVISASWVRRHDDGHEEANLRGVAQVLALSKYLKGYSLWAKDLIFVISDGYLDGMQAWLSSYHGSTQSNLQAEELPHTSGVIWNALAVDYACHSFSHLGIFHEGLNGRLPNQDLMNSFERISRFTGGVPVVLYDHVQGFVDLPKWIPQPIRNNPTVQTYAKQAKNVIRHVKYQAPGQPSGIHGLFHPYRIDAFTIYAVCATGPHGFHALGRVMESTLRTMNNLLERLHASFFFYILTDAMHFNKIGTYLPSAILVSVGMMFQGLDIWVNAGWRIDDGPSGKTSTTQDRTWVRRQRPVLFALGIMAVTHILGALLFTVLSSTFVFAHFKTTSPLLFAVLALAPIGLVTVVPRQRRVDVAPIGVVLKALNLCFASTIISVISVLNFSLALSLSIALGIPLALSAPSKRILYPVYLVLAAGWLVALPEQTQTALWNWQVLSVWFAPVICIVYVPLVLQAAMVILLPL